MQRIAISGASGLIGSSLSSALLAAGKSVVHLVRPGSSGSATKGPVETLCWDPSTGIQGLADVEPLDGVVHLAGRSLGAARWSDREKKLLRDSRILATLKLAEQFVKHNWQPRVFVSASAIGIYGDTGAERVSEDHSISPTSFLGELARDWEAAADPLRETECRVVHPRLGIVLAQTGGALGEMLPIFRWGVGGRLGSGGQFWSWIAIQDCVAALCWLLEKECSGVYNLTAPEPVTNGALTKAFAAAIGRPAVLPVPAFALRLGLGEMADAALLTSCAAVPNRLLADGFSFSYPTLDSYFGTWKSS